MQVAAPFCMLCGCRCADPDACRVADASSVQSLVSRHCTKTALHYRALMALPASARMPLCMPCVNWKRRSSKRGAKASRPSWKSLTPLDSALLHALAPGHYPEPDRRCFARLAEVAADPHNGFAACVPEALRGILSSRLEGGRPQHLCVLEGWWAANDRGAFFRFPETARAVRHGLVCPDPAQGEARRRWRR